MMIEEELNRQLLGHGIKAKPHIESRIKTLKNDHRIIYNMINGVRCSGFGWDSSRNMMTAEKDFWDSYVQSHPNVSRRRNRTFPHYDMLSNIFGKDRVTGKDVGIAEDVLEELSRNEENVDMSSVGLDCE